MEQFVCVEDFHQASIRNLGENARQFYESGADDERTVQGNLDALSRLNCLSHFVKNQFIHLRGIMKKIVRVLYFIFI